MKPQEAVIVQSLAGGGEGEHSISAVEVEPENVGLVQKQPARKGRKKKVGSIVAEERCRRSRRAVKTVDYREDNESYDLKEDDGEEPKARRRMKKKDENGNDIQSNMCTKRAVEFVDESDDLKEDDGDEEDTIVSRKQRKRGHEPSIGAIRSDEEPKARRRMKKKDENGNDVLSNMCYQCQRNDKGRVVRCHNCSRKRYCVPT